MKRFLSTIVILFLAVNISADNSSDARKILDKVATKISHKGGAQAHFTLTGKGYNKQNGNIYVKGKKFHITTKETTMWYDGNTLWTYIKINDEVNITTPTAKQQIILNPYSFIYLYKKGYDLSYVKKGSAYQIHLVAQRKTDIKEMYIMVNSKYMPQQIRMNQNGKWLIIDISGFIAKDQPNNRFVFNQKNYKTAEIIDLRD